MLEGVNLLGRCRSLAGVDHRGSWRERTCKSSGFRECRGARSGASNVLSGNQRLVIQRHTVITKDLDNDDVGEYPAVGYFANLKMDHRQNGTADIGARHSTPRLKLTANFWAMGTG